MTRPVSIILALAAAAGIVLIARLAVVAPAIPALAPALPAQAQPPAPVPPATRPAELSILWKAELGKPIVAAPAVAGQSVFVADQAGRLTSLDLSTGKQRWQTDLGAAISASPLVAGDVVYVGDEQGKVHAVQAGSGRDRVLLTAGDKIVGRAALREGILYVGSYDRSLYAIDLATGQTLWSFETQAQVNAAPVIAGDTVLVAGCDANLRALDAKTGQQRWATDVGGPVAAAPLVSDGRVFAATLKGDRVAVDSAAGTVIWTAHAEADADGGASFTASPATAPQTPDCVDFTSQSGEVFSHELGSGKLKATHSVGGRMSASPVLWLGSFVFATEEGKLYGPVGRNGDSGLLFTAGAGLKGSPAAAGDRLLVGDEDGTVWCLAKSLAKASAKSK